MLQHFANLCRTSIPVDSTSIVTTLQGFSSSNYGTLTKLNLSLNSNSSLDKDEIVADDIMSAWYLPPDAVFPSTLDIGKQGDMIGKNFVAQRASADDKYLFDETVAQLKAGKRVA